MGTLGITGTKSDSPSALDGFYRATQVCGPETSLP